MMDWKEKKVLVIGTGISGIAATDLLCEVGADVVLYDGNEQLKEETIREKALMLLQTVKRKFPSFPNGIRMWKSD